MQQETTLVTEKEIPAGVKGWNWGAFFFSWFWGLCNNTYIALLCFVPIVNFVMPFVLGVKGNEWAWKNGEWQSVAYFRKIQRNWGIGALITIVVSIFLIIVLLAGDDSDIKSSIPYQMTAINVLNTAESRQLLGSPITIDAVDASNIDEEDGIAHFVLTVSGPNGTGTVNSVLEKSYGVWAFAKLILQDDQTGQELDYMGNTETDNSDTDDENHDDENNNVSYTTGMLDNQNTNE